MALLHPYTRAEAGDWVVADPNVSLPSGPRVFEAVAALRLGATALTSNSSVAVQALYTISDTTLNGQPLTAERAVSALCGLLQTMGDANDD